MAVKKKAQKPSPQHQFDIEDIINRGGGTTAEAAAKSVAEEIRFTLRIPQDLITKIDKERRGRVGTVSRNQWILEAVADKLS